jgi:hypothetical protein
MRAVCCLKLVFAAATLCAGFAATALAQDSAPLPAAPPSDAAQQPPPAAAAPTLPDNPLPGTAAPAPASAAAPQATVPQATTSDLQSCLQETGDYVMRGKSVIYVIGIANTCDKQLRCEIFANVTGARGTTLGHTVMVLGRASSGAAAKKSYNMKVKAAGGTVQVSRDCKVL